MNEAATLANKLVVCEPATNIRGQLMAAAYQLIKDRLLEGWYSPGEKVLPDEIMERIKASRQPVMDAIRRLAAEGFITIVPQVGCLVIRPEPQQIGDFLRMLASIEGTCMELACERASDEEIRVLRTIVSTFQTEIAAMPDDADFTHEIRLHNRAFHNYLYSIAHSDMVSDLAASLSDRADFYIGNALGTHTFYSRLDDVIEEHRRIAEVLSWRDPHASRRVIEAHVLAFIDSLNQTQSIVRRVSSPKRRRASNNE